jgi:hypothetical protein
VRQLGVTTAKSSPNITMVVHLTSPDGRYDALYLSNFANCCGSRRAGALRRASARHWPSAPATTRCAIWIDPDAAARVA